MSMISSKFINYWALGKILVLMIGLCVFGCQSIGPRGASICNIYLESEAEMGIGSVVKTLPISKLSINVIPIPIITNRGIARAYTGHGNCGTILHIVLTDREIYELYQTLFECVGRRLLLEYNGTVIGFSQISEGEMQDFVFIPEVSDESCQRFCRFINSKR